MFGKNQLNSLKVKTQVLKTSQLPQIQQANLQQLSIEQLTSVVGGGIIVNDMQSSLRYPPGPY